MCLRIHQKSLPNDTRFQLSINYVWALVFFSSHHFICELGRQDTSDWREMYQILVLFGMLHVEVSGKHSSGGDVGCLAPKSSEADEITVWSGLSGLNIGLRSFAKKALCDLHM